MKYLIMGVNGMLGHTVARYLKNRGHEVLGFARRPSLFVPTVTGDALCKNTVMNMVRDFDGDHIVNCIGILNKDAEDKKDEAVYINGFLPHYLAALTEGTCKRVIQISTDCVFSGEKGGYTNRDVPDGVSFYDRTKAMGELDDGRNLTLRQSIVGPDINPVGIGLLNWFMKQSGEIKGYTGAIWTGQTSLQLAKTIEIAAENGAVGLYNAVPDKSISKYELLCLFNRYLRDGEVNITPYGGVKCDKSLVNTPFDFPYTIPDYEEMVYELCNYIKENPKIYPHYR